MGTVCRLNVNELALCVNAYNASEKRVIHVRLQWICRVFECIGNDARLNNFEQLFIAYLYVGEEFPIQIAAVN